MSLTSIKEKVCKLLALSNSSNEHEAGIALARAQAIILEHKLSIAECLAAGNLFADEAIVRHGVPLIASKRLSQWQWVLAGKLAKHNDCKVLNLKGVGLIIYGRDSDIVNVRILLDYCIAQLWNLAPTGKGRVYSDSWYLGACYTIGTKLDAMRVKALETVTTFGLVKLNEQSSKVDSFISNTTKVTPGKASQAKLDYSGYFQGKQDGQQVNVVKQNSLS